MSNTTPAWQTALNNLPETTKIPSFFLAHGSPALIYPPELPNQLMHPDSIQGSRGPLAQFLSYFGDFVLKKYKPKAIVVFSAHWETSDQIEIMSYEKNHLLYDYYGFPKQLYDLKFESKGSPEIANRINELFKKNNIPSKTITKGRGLDHGVFVPFLLMFPNGIDIPIVEVSIDARLDPQYHIDIGKAITPLREEGILILSGGLTIHTFKEFEAWKPETAPKGFHDFHNAIVSSIEDTKNGEERNEALKALTKHPFFRRSHPREEHFVPIYVGAGAGSEGGAQIVSNLYGAITAAYGL